MVKTELSNVEKILSDHLADKTTESGNGPSFFSTPYESLSVLGKIHYW